VTRSFADVGFFALRTPLMPWHVFAADVEQRDGRSWHERRAEKRDRLRALVARPEVREALYLASPSLYESLPGWLEAEDPDADVARAVERPLVRYLARMAGRSTPFGLFAGVGLGTVAAETRLELAPRARWRRACSLDCGVMAEVLDRAAREHRGEVPWVANDTLYRVDAEWRFVQHADDVCYLASAASDAFLDTALDAARRGGGVTEAALAAAICERHREAAALAAAEVVAAMIDAQLLVPALGPLVVTATRPPPDMLGALQRLPAALRPPLERVAAALEVLERAPLGAEPARYTAINAAVRDLGAAAGTSGSVQVDLHKPCEARLGTTLVEVIERGVLALHAITPRDDRLERFRSEFRARWGTAAVPLVEVLDEDTGIGFEIERAPETECAPLLAGLPGRAVPAPASAWRSRDALLARRVASLARGGGQILTLSDRDLAALRADRIPPLPLAVSVLAAVTRAGQVHISRTWMPSAAAPFSRFARSDPALTAALRCLVEREQALAPHAVFAEIAHVPPDRRDGNVVTRPRLRDATIAWRGEWLAATGDDAGIQLAVDDLLVSIDDARVRLWSLSLAREIIPRLASAHFHLLGTLPLYRFLAALQRSAGESTLRWQWGALEAFAFLPRVVVGDAILALARWRLDDEDIARLDRLAEPARFAALARLRAERGLPRVVSFDEWDNVLPIDLDDSTSVDAWWAIARKRPAIDLHEILDDDCVAGDDGRYRNELVVPFVRLDPEPAPAGPPPALRVPSAPGAIDEAVGRASMRGPRAAVDGWIPSIAEVLERARTAGLCATWWLERQRTPAWGLALAWRATRRRGWSALVEIVDAWARAQVRPVCALQFEVLAAPSAARSVEAWLHRDSVTAAQMLAAIGGDDGARWRASLRVVDRAIRRFAAHEEHALQLASAGRDACAAGRARDVAFTRALGERHRHRRAAIEDALAVSSRELPRTLVELLDNAAVPPGSAVHTLEAVDEVRIVHAAACRVVQTASLDEAFVVFDDLARIYASQLARARRPRTADRG
jgi:lantibiotic biosynthesis protein